MAEIRVILGDITRVEAGAIVNAANAGLRGGGGVDGAIHRAAGPAVMEECRALMADRPPLSPGEVVATGAGTLSARFILHAVGPIWGDEPPEKQDEQLASCYRHALTLAAELGCTSVALPNIATGVYGFPKERAATVAVAAVTAALHDLPALDRVVFVCFDDTNHHLTAAALETT
jgi:O-acetyl-ADP-ribose deacetylase (regulator of RNase III)